ncbi:MAG: TonB-dependent receptor plug domain-containing protein, partial [Ignavibacteria bacterium]|nr:TonB-dependent receptor plug domain-containing protein [Ignavibacteria bacterium]
MNRALILLLFFASFKLFSEETDTNRVFRLNQINIEGKKSLSQKELEFSAINILTRSDIKRSNYFQISEVLSKSPGIFIKNYGGLGGLKTVTLRGTNSMQTVIAFDGIPLNSIQNGSFNLTGIPLSIIDKVEVTRGGASSSFGSNSIAGAINFVPKIADNNEFELCVKHTSFAETQLMSSYNFKTSSIKNSISIDWTNSSGDYPFEFLQFGENKTVRRTNNSYKNLTFSYSNEYLNNNNNFRNTIIYENSKRGAPGAVLQGRIESNKANLSEQKVFAKSSYDYVYSEYFLIGLDVAYRYSYMHFIDPELPSIN